MILRLLFFVVRHRYRDAKTWHRDRDVLYEAAQLAEFLRDRRVGRIHAPWADHAALLAFVASRLLGVPYSVQARASEIHRVAESGRVRDRIRFADFVITNSRYNERYLAEACRPGRVPPIHVVYNGLDLSHFRPVAAPARRDGPMRLLGVGRLVEPKGFVHLLEACDLLRTRGVAFTCDIIGGPQAFDTNTWIELRTRHSALGLESVVRFLGEQPLSVTMAAYEASDIFVLPCVRGHDGSHDITPNSLLEAMAMQLPVVSTTSGAIPEMVEHGVSGILVPPADPRALADAIAMLVSDPALRVTLGAAARRKVAEQFDARRNASVREGLLN